MLCENAAKHEDNPHLRAIPGEATSPQRVPHPLRIFRNFPSFEFEVSVARLLPQTRFQPNMQILILDDAMDPVNACCTILDPAQAPWHRIFNLSDRFFRNFSDVKFRVPAAQCAPFTLKGRRRFIMPLRVQAAAFLAGCGIHINNSMLALFGSKQAHPKWGLVMFCTPLESNSRPKELKRNISLVGYTSIAMRCANVSQVLECFSLSSFQY